VTSARSDDEGFLKIVDRKKEIIINAPARNMCLRTSSGRDQDRQPLIGQAATSETPARTTRRSSCSTADYRARAAVGQAERARGKALEELATEPTMIAAVQAGIDEAKQHLGSGRADQEVHDRAGRLAAGGDELERPR